MQFRIASTILATALFSGFSGISTAQMLDQTISPKEIGPVSVAMNDNASGACWTNLREVREYAEEKLRTRGYELSGDDKDLVNYTLLINVDGFRSKAEPFCVGSIMVILAKGVEQDEIFGLHMINMENSVATSSLNGNLNQRVIEVVQAAVDSM